jgi:hypothetical protein
MIYPRPSWTPRIDEDLGEIADRCAEYTDRCKAFAVFKWGTAIYSLSRTERSDAEYKQILALVVRTSPDFAVSHMKDRNFLVSFVGPVSGVVLRKTLDTHTAEIFENAPRGGILPDEHLVPTAYTTHEKFCVGLYARARLYQDAEDQELVVRFVPQNND